MAWTLGHLSINHYSFLFLSLFCVNLCGMSVIRLKEYIIIIITGWFGRASHHEKLAPTFPGIDICLMVTKWDFFEMEALL